MTWLSALFVGTVFAFEGIISPLPNDVPPIAEVITSPSISFRSLTTPTVLGLSTQQNQIETQQDIQTPRKARAKHMTIAVIGDSMTDTLGPNIPDLQKRLASIYPQTIFQILNYGVGGTNIDYGIHRLTHEYEYLGIRYPSLVSQKPDLIIIESFAYNPYTFDEGAIDTHWLALAKIIDIIKTQTPQATIAIAATIAPNDTVFGDGAPHISFSREDKIQRVAVIRRYLENAIKFADSQHIPLIDAYTPSLGNDKNGQIAYINAGDHIHYSPEGREFVARIMTDTIVAEKLLE